MVCSIPSLTGSLLRTFICADIPDKQRQTISAWLGARRSESTEVRWVQPKTIHITLKFCGERAPDTVSLLAENLLKIKKIGEITISAGKIGGFPDMLTPSVIWTAVEGDLLSLKALQKETEFAANRAGIPKESRPYTPHLTLGRNPSRKVLSDKLMRGIQEHRLDIEPWTVSQIILMKSELLPSGPRYTPLGLFKI